MLLRLVRALRIVFYNKQSPIICRGHPAYGEGVKLSKTKNGSNVEATYYMTYHSVLKTDAEYIDALNFSLNLAKDIQDIIRANCSTCGDVEVIPYRYVKGCWIKISHA